MQVWPSCLWCLHLPSGNVDNAVKILADFIVEDKAAVIQYLNENGYAQLPFDANIMKVNDAVADNILDPKFVEGLSKVIFEYRGVITPEAQLIAEGTQGGGGNPATWITKIAEIGSDLVSQAKQEDIDRRALGAQYALEQQRIEAETEIAQRRARQDFAFELKKAQQQGLQKNNVRNLILLLGVMAFLGIVYYATGRTRK